MERPEGGQERRMRKYERRRSEIIDAAEEVLQARGLMDATMDQIAERAALSKATIYNYFDSKDDIILAIATRSHWRMQEAFRKASEEGRNGLERVMTAGRAFYGLAIGKPVYREVLHHPKVLEVSHSPGPEVKEGLGREESELVACHREFGRIWVGIVQGGIDDGSIRHDIDAPLIATVLSMRRSGVIDELSHGGKMMESIGASEEEMLEQILEILTHGLSND